MMGAERQGNAMRRIWSRAVALVLCAGMLTGCSRLMTWTIFDTVNLVKDTFNGDHDGDGDSDWSEHSINDSEDYLMEGDNVFSLDPYPLEEGVAPLLEEIDKRLGSLLNSRFNVDAVRLDVDPSGNVTGAGLRICRYLGTQPSFDGGFTVEWDSSERMLIYHTAGTLYDNDPTGGYNENLSADFLNANLAALPLEALRSAMPGGLTIRFEAFAWPPAGETVVDMRSGAPQAIDLSQAAVGAYGTADGTPQWMLTVQQADGAGDADSQLRFCYAPAVPEHWIGNPASYTQKDVIVTETGLRYTRDWGETWKALPSQYTGLARACLEDYTDVTRSSWSISDEEGGPVAFLLGGNDATLVYSMDDGATWSEESLGSTDDATLDRRVAQLLPNGMGLAAAGGNWTMGSGCWRALVVTQDGGQTWNTVSDTLPGERSICGASITEDGTIMISLETASQDNWPEVYVSTDAGQSWTPVNMPWTDAELQEVSWIYRLDSLTRTEDGWMARFTQEPMGNWAAEFTATDLTGYWQYGGRVHVQS